VVAKWGGAPVLAGESAGAGTGTCTSCRWAPSLAFDDDVNDGGATACAASAATPASSSAVPGTNDCGIFGEEAGSRTGRLSLSSQSGESESVESVESSPDTSDRFSLLPLNLHVHVLHVWWDRYT